MTMEISQDELKSLLRYDPETGDFVWLVNRGRVKTEGKAAGTIKDGYLRISINNKLYYAHRLAFIYMGMEPPKEETDHIDGNRRNNAFSNLRAVSPLINNQNQRKAKSSNSCGVLGVSLDKAGKTWTASIRYGGKKHHLGRFESSEAAHAAYVKEKRARHVGCTI